MKLCTQRVLGVVGRFARMHITLVTVYHAVEGSKTATLASVI